MIENKISCLVFAYNESARIKTAIEGLVPWADEVIVCDKGSIDDTTDIARSISEKVRILTIPLTPKGRENHAEIMSHAANDWIYVATCSEVPTRNLVLQMDRLLSEKKDQVDVIGIPRKMYVLGSHCESSVWNISIYPFLVNRKRVLLPGFVHEPFRASSPDRLAVVQYTPSTCVHHFTHPSFKAFMDAHVDYAADEASLENPGEFRRRLKQALNSLLLSFSGDHHAQAHGAGYAIYSLMVCLKMYEKAFGGPWHKFYAQEAGNVIRNEWGVIPKSQSSPAMPAERKTKRGSGISIYGFFIRGFVRLLVLIALRNNRISKTS